MSSWSILLAESTTPASRRARAPDDDEGMEPATIVRMQGTRGEDHQASTNAVAGSTSSRSRARSPSEELLPHFDNTQTDYVVPDSAVVFSREEIRDQQIQRQVAEELRRRLEEEQARHLVVAAVHVDPVEEESLEGHKAPSSPPSSSSTVCWIPVSRKGQLIAGLAVLVVIGVAVGISVAFTTQSSGASESSRKESSESNKSNVNPTLSPTIPPTKFPTKTPSSSPTSAPTTLAPTEAPSGSPSSARFAAFVDQYLEALPSGTPTNTSVFLDPETAQSKAMNWLVETDPIQLDLDATEADVFLERYLCALLYFALGAAFPVPPGRNYLNGRPVCLWEGLGCSPSSGQVFAVFRSNQGLRGSLPTELGLLTAVSEVDFSLNFIRGTLPSEIGYMQDLHAFQIRSNEISGSIPSEVGRLATLRGLELTDNRMVGRLPADMGNLSSLTWLYLGENEFSGEVPWSWRGMSALSSLRLQDNKLEGSLDPVFCAFGRVWDRSFWADCGRNGAPGAVECTCCNSCY